MEKISILLVQDFTIEKSKSLKSELLSMFPYASVKDVSSFEQACQELNSCQPDLVIVNNFLFSKDLSAFLQSIEKHLLLVLVLLPTNNQDVFKIDAYQHQLFDVVYLPLAPSLLELKIRFLLDCSRIRVQCAEMEAVLEAKDLELEVLQRELEEKQESTGFLSSVDPITGLFNRRYFEENLVKEWRHASREKFSLALLLAEVDGFQRFCDNYGSHEADDCIRSIGRRLHEALYRPVDILAYYDTNKFIIILPDTAKEGAGKVASRMMENVQKLSIPTGESGLHQHLSVSIGVAILNPAGNIKIDDRVDNKVSDLISVAQQALVQVDGAGGTYFIERSVR